MWAKMDLTEIVQRNWPDSLQGGLKESGSYQHGNGRSVSVKRAAYLDRLNNYRPPAPWS